MRARAPDAMMARKPNETARRKIRDGSSLQPPDETATVRRRSRCAPVASATFPGRWRRAGSKGGELTVRMGITKRKLLTGLIAAAVFAGGIGASVLPASAEQRTLVVTLMGGQTVTVTVDVPPGTPIDQITIPGITLPIVSVSEVPPATTTTETTPSGDQPAPQQPAPAAAPTAPTAAAAKPDDAAKKATGDAKHKAKAK